MMGTWLHGRLLIVVCLSWSWLISAEHHFKRHHHGAHFQHEEQIRHRRQRPADISTPKNIPHFVLTDYYGLGEDERKEDVQDAGPWSAWTELSPCSRTCDGGVATQSRQCLDGRPSNESSCRGASKRHFSCNIQDCPENAGDFRSEQCSAFNNVAFEGRYYEWIPYTKAPNKCELNCMPRGERFYYRHKRKVIDGTRCSDEGLDICVEGECLPVGCDLMLGSTSKEDKCRECGGDGSACTTVEGVFDSSHLQVGYNDILLIPVGATNIVIREKKASNNYLAVRNATGHYYLNGNWRIDFPRDMKFAGTTFHYERTAQNYFSPESITALGPVTEALYIVLLYQEHNPGIEYEYSVPKGVNQPQPDSYAWIFANWGECSATCGGGVQTRNVSCAKTTTLEVVPDDLCDPQLQPPTNRSCATEPCPASWYVSEWTECSSSCGAGIQFRTVQCQQVISGSVPAIVDDLECLETVGPRPKSQQTCNEGTECPSWHLGPWSACDRLCGEGQRHRPVTCHRAVDGVIEKLEDEACATHKPPTMEGCFIRPCEGVDWVTTEWSGCENSCGLTLESREAFCASAKGRVFPAKYCPEQRKPSLTRECAKASPCVYAWYASQWSQCSSKCGAGVQTRKVFCGTWEGTNLVPVSNDKCDPEKRYDNVTDCVGTGECAGSWAAGPWSPCSATCGRGTQERKVICLVDNEAATADKCDAESILFASESCNKQPCGTVDEVTTAKSDGLVEECEDVEEEVEDETEGSVTEEVEDETEGSVTKENAVDKDYDDPPRQANEVDLNQDLMSVSGSPTSPEPTHQTTLGQGVTLGPRIVPDELQEGSGDELEVKVPLIPAEGSGSVSNFEAGSGVSSGLGIGSGSGLGSGVVLTDIADIMESGSGEEDKETGGFMTTSSGFLEEEIMPVSTEKSAIAVTKKPTTKPVAVTTEAPMVETTTKKHKPVTEKPIKKKKKQTVKRCRMVEVSTEAMPVTCESSKFGCCPDNLTPAKGPFEQGCAKPKTCSDTEFGCCTDGVTAADGPNHLGCPSMLCKDTLFGCCPDGMTAAEGPDKEGCKMEKMEEELMPVSCKDTEFGCCHDGITAARGPNNLGCQRCDEASGDIEGSGSGQCESRTASGSGEDIVLTTAAPTVADCSVSEFGCCPDGQTPAAGENHLGCEKEEKEKDCQETEFGCCPDKTTAATGPNYAGCVMPCTNSTFGCCPDGVSPAHGPNEQGCCLATRYGCCPDNITPAQSPDLEGCGCQYSAFGCCPDNKTASRGPGYDGCGCQYTPHGCCPDQYTPAAGPEMKGCHCSTHPHGCCPDGVTVAKGPKLEGCGCEHTAHGCCPDGRTPAPAEGASGCPCVASRYGCCLDGVTAAQGPWFEGCDEIPVRGEACGIDKDRGPCRNFTVKWFFDLEYGGCSRFWYGGCEGNNNRFVSQEECKTHCVEPTGFAACSLPKVVGPCEGNYPSWYHDTTTGKCQQFTYGGCLGNNNRFSTLDQCQQTCLAPKQLDVCHQAKVEGICRGNFSRWYYDQSGGMCQEFAYGGCHGNGNNFLSSQECDQRCKEAGQSRENVCAMPQLVGDCTDYVQRYFYDGAEGRCRPFYYGGCGGNGNNFATLDECNNQCQAVKEVEPETPVFETKFCFLPKDEGPCQESVTSWYYDFNDGVCKQFLYGGCQGNQNRFVNRQECEDRCSLSQDLCTLPRVVGPCSGSFRQWFYDKNADSCYEFDYGGCQGNPNRFNTEDQCVERCQKRRAETTTWTSATTTTTESALEYHTTQAPSTADSSDICRLEVSPGPCRGSLPAWYYNATLQRCQAFSYGGCDGNANRFQSEEHCQRQCGDFRGHDVCSLPVQAGHCRGQFRKYYFDTETHACREFRYGGCGGNGNRFSTLEECQTVCFQRSEVSAPGNATAASNAVVCRLPSEAGPCRDGFKRWFFDVERGTCVPFLYGGCAGNMNRFKTFEACISFCSAAREAVQRSNESINEVDVDGEEREKSVSSPTTEAPQLPVEEDRCAAQRSHCASLQCPYGKESYANGEQCEVCQCRDPCKDIRCPEGSRCIVGFERADDAASTEHGSGLNFTASCNPITKLGECPAMPASSVSCEDESECRNDADCPNSYKCCYNGCGYSCVEPATKEELTTQAPQPVYTPEPQPEEPRGIAPWIVAAEPQVLAEEGSLATLRCDARGTPTPAVYWRRGADQITSDEGRFKVLVDGSLQVLGVDRFDAGLYTCIADNGIGSPAVRQVRLDVKVVPTARLTSDKSTYSFGSQITLQCEVTGYPLPDVDWYKDGVRLETRDRVEIMENHTVIISKAEASDSGSYSCDAINQAGRGTSTTSVTVEGVTLHPNCTDNPFFANCKLIIKARYCTNKYYARFCCRSCTLAGQLPSVGPHLNDYKTGTARRK